MSEKDTNKIPELNEMEPREAFEWEYWKIWRGNCAKRNGVDYDFDKLPEEMKLKEYSMFEEIYKKIKEENK